MDFSIPGHKAIAVDDVIGQAEIRGAVPHEFIEFLERTFIEQQLYPFAGGELALSMLTLFPFCAAAFFRTPMAFLQLVHSIANHSRPGWCDDISSTLHVRY